MALESYVVSSVEIASSFKPQLWHLMYDNPPSQVLWINLEPQVQKARERLNQVYDDHSILAEREDPIKQFFEAIIELKTIGKVYFEDLERKPRSTSTLLEDEIDVPIDISKAERIDWGPDEKGVYYLLYGPTWEIVDRCLTAQNEDLLRSKAALLDEIEQKGILDRPQGNRKAVKKKTVKESIGVLPVLGKAFKLVVEDEA